VRGVWILTGTPEWQRDHPSIFYKVEGALGICEGRGGRPKKYGFKQEPD